MNFYSLKFFSQNIQKNNFIINTILKIYANFDIIFIQELLWNSICSIPSNYNNKGKSLMGVVNYPNWLTFTRLPASSSDHPRVAIFINIRLLSFCFFFAKTLLITEIFLWSPSSTKMSFAGLWTFILIHLILLSNISRIQNSTLEIC